MEEAEQVVDECLEAYRGAVIGDGSRRYNTAFMNYVEVGNVLQLAKTVVMGARARTETRGAHSRQDCPSRDDANFLKHTLVSLDGGAFTVGYRPVAVTKFQPQERKY